MNYIYDHAPRPRRSTAGHTIVPGDAAQLRRYYRTLRDAGISATSARIVISGCIFVGSLGGYRWHRTRPAELAQFSTTVRHFTAPRVDAEVAA